MIKPPKGKALIIGGAEDIGENEFLDRERRRNKYFQPYEILKELFKASKNKNIEIITSASRIQDDIRRRYERAFRKIRFPTPGFISVDSHYEAKRREYVERIEKASAVFFTGGDQCRLLRIIGKTPLMDTIKNKYQYERDFLIAGTSAGAMIMSPIMITGGGEQEALYKLDLKLDKGIGILKDCIIDTHFIKRGRFSRLAHAVIDNPKLLGVGLGEDTALIVRNGTEAECRGSGMVIIIDGSHIGKTNTDKALEDEPIYVENLKVHLLVKGCKFSFSTRRMIVNERLRKLR